MKKKLSIILLSVVFVLSSALMLACSNESKDDIFGDYGFTNPPELEKNLRYRIRAWCWTENSTRISGRTISSGGRARRLTAQTATIL